MIRFALNFNRKLTILVDFTDSKPERIGLYVNYFVTITSLLRVQCTLYYVRFSPLETKF